MTDLTRRELLQALGALGTATLLPNCSSDPAPTDAGQPMDASMPTDAPRDGDDRDRGMPPLPRHAFVHGVASGDPLPDAVILWTRVTPLPDMPAPASVEVSWELATAPDFASIAARGMFTTNPGRDFTVKVDATGLMPATTYYYRFRALGFVSPVGRTRTAPRAAVDRLRFAVVSCSSLAHGYFHVYRALAARADLDAVLHLGDYIYEYANDRYGSERTYDPPTECIRLEDYRRRYAWYRRDADLRAVHQQHPFIAVWDDHELANNAWQEGAENHMIEEGEWRPRRAAAEQAYREWMPIREQPDGRIWRRLRYGDLAEIIMLDTRIWGRQEQRLVDGGASQDPMRTLLGADQERFLFEAVTRSTSRWKLLGQQVIMGQIYLIHNKDQWDGYPAARQRFFDVLRTMNARDVVVLTGDIHASVVFELTPDPRDRMSYDPSTGRGALAVEFVTPAVSSPGLPAPVAALVPQILRDSPHIKYAELLRRGYIVLDVTAARVQAAYFHFEDITRRAPQTESFATAFSVASGMSRLARDMAAAPAPASAPALAPGDP